MMEKELLSYREFIDLNAKLKEEIFVKIDLMQERIARSIETKASNEKVETLETDLKEMINKKADMTFVGFSLATLFLILIIAIFIGDKLNLLDNIAF